MTSAVDADLLRTVIHFLCLKRTNHLLGLGCDDVLTKVIVLTGHCVIGKHAERMRLQFTESCHRCGSAVSHFLCQCPSLATCRFKFFWLPIFCQLDGAIIC